MKQIKIKNFTFFLLAMLLIGTYSCESEPVDSSDATAGKKGNKETKGNSNRTNLDLLQVCSIDSSTNLYAGQNILVGEVTVDIEGDNYIITYNITNNEYCLSETHLSVVNTPEDFPMSAGGNPKNGHFEYSESHGCASSFSYEVPVSRGTYIAAHGVVNCVDSYDDIQFDTSLPETLDFCLRTGREVDNAKGYFRLVVEEGNLAGTYWAWCADVSLAINASGQDICYEDFNVLSISDDLSSIISQSDNIDNALWLINNVDALLESNEYLYGHIQWAFWKLLNNQDCVGCNSNLNLPSGDYTVKGMEVVDLALTNGDNYIPECSENRIMVLNDGVNQPLIVPVTVNCESSGDCEETAWADGCDFPGNNWATYFHYSN